ncbi:hypothetical protein LguiA_031536 [Lonicera macranthoides]
MDKITLLFPLLNVHFLILKFILHFSVVHAGTTSLCSQTPYPELCINSFITSTQPQATLDESQFSIRASTLKFTMVQAEQVHWLISTMDTSSFDERAKLAWADCLELYEDTLSHLNRSISSKPNSPQDIQTWLSAAKTNDQTCQNGFIDFNLSSNLQSFPFMLKKFSKTLSNSLAINKATTTASPSAHGLPEWVGRRLVESVVRADVVVAQDGSGHYKTICEAVAESAKLRRRRRRGNKGNKLKRFVIHVKAGVYKENVEIKKSMKNLVFIGDGIDVTIVTGSRNVQDGSTTFRSATFAVSGAGFIARDMTFENTAGPEKNQAVALRSNSDFSVFYRCSFKGYQDTLYVHSHRQFYRDCDIYGTIDFIFGDAVVVLQNCNIHVRQHLTGKMNTITAQGRSDPNENTGIVIHNSRVQVARGPCKTYLGRPWKQYSRTVFIKSFLDGRIDPAGWLPWSGNFALKTLYYGEYMNTGSGADTRGRVTWPGYHVIRNVREAEKFSVGNFLAGSSWIPATRVPCASRI